MTRFPKTTLILTLAALAVFLIPGAASCLQYDRVAIGQGQLWRLATGHWTHANANQLFWDALAFAALGALCERRDRRAFGVCLGLGALAAALAVWLGRPELRYYRGLSGLDAALFTLLAGQLLRDAIAGHRFSLAAGLILLGLGFLGKITYEELQGATLFVANTAGMAPVALAHLAGAAAGGVALATPPARHRGRI